MYYSSSWAAFCNISLNCVSDFISIFQFVSLAANLAFCPDFPIAKDNWSSGTITWANFSSSLISTAIIFAGNKAADINIAGSGFHSITSIFSPFNSFITFWILTPFCPTQEPTGSIFSSGEYTATLLLYPGSRETLFISINPSYISGISNSNNFLTKSGWLLDTITWGAPFNPF